MKEIERLKALGIAPADILLPREGTDMSRWAAIACDQYTSQPEYWEKAYEWVSGSPSALRLIVPEAYLETDRGATLQKSAVAAMDAYLDGGVFGEVPQSFVYVERSTPHTALRRGLVAAFDLEMYDFSPGNHMPIRATEGTILSRLPPRVAVRGQAALECPHIMILIDDPGHTVIEPLANERESLQRLYAADLMAGAGSVSGWRVHGGDAFARVAMALEGLAARGGMLFAVGDGNHSLAAAKACWDGLKTQLPPQQRENHPARWALAELVNIHDAGLAFHPIHRVVFHAEPVELIAMLLWEMNRRGWRATMGKEPVGTQSIRYCCAQDRGFVNVSSPQHPLAAGTLQTALDEVLPQMEGAAVDYVHGDDTAAGLGSREQSTAFLLPPMHKSDLFPAVEQLGVLPRKAFSMGEAAEKRFYLECRRIRQ